MAVDCDIGNGSNVHIANNAQIVQTTRGPVQADQLKQGDMVYHVGGEPPVTIVAPPVVS